MDIIKLAREIGKGLQQDERYLAMQLAQQKTDEDKELQQAIGEFNLKRMAINNEAQKPDRSDDTIAEMNGELRKIYAEIMKNDNMAVYNKAKAEFDAVLQEVTGIITLCAQGEDPDTVDYAASCSGNCGSCAGCS